MNDAFRFAASYVSPSELTTRLQFGMVELWPDSIASPDRWHFMADLIDSDRGLLAALEGAVSTPAVEALTATAELCRQSATNSVLQCDWALLRRASTWLERTGSETDRAVLAVAEELALTGLDGVEADFSMVAWLCLETFARFVVDGETVGYWVRRANSSESNSRGREIDSDVEQDERIQLSVAV